MKLKKYSFIFLFVLILCVKLSAQQSSTSFYIKDLISSNPLEGVEVYDSKIGFLTKSDKDGFIEIDLSSNNNLIIVFSFGYNILELKPNEINSNTVYFLKPNAENLNEVEVIARNTKIFSLKRLKDFEGTSINAGKKNEVILVQESLANLASNNARQIFAQVPGLNIYQNDDAGLQLNIGGRGLDPNRSSNFNTRQNGYDISADVLGYPESYYAPPSEALSQIQIIRGAASLQYGTQFGGLVNFIFKGPDKTKRLNLKLRNTIGSNNLYTNFTNISGGLDKISYNIIYNHKNGSGFRPNSNFESNNLFFNIGYELNTNTNLNLEFTKFNYLSQQAGGLTDNMFDDNPFQSNRERNWFAIDWFLYNLKFEKKFSEKTNFVFSFFGLKASRKAVGFRVNRVSQVDSDNERDLIVGEFENFGFESKLLSSHTILNVNSIFLLGFKYYNSYNSGAQGPGSDSDDADFRFYFDKFPNYNKQSFFNFPNLNIAFFGENIFEVNDKLSLTPGFRLEYINTKSDGYFRNIIQDAAFNVILNEIVNESRVNERLFLLTGLGVSYDFVSSLEFYLNISQNYRSVTFADISTINPAYAIDPNISDESGFSFDLGLRGQYKKLFSYDVNGFLINYSNRIGFTQKITSLGNVKAFRTNTGDAILYGLEGTTDLNLNSIFTNQSEFNFNVFTNFSFMSSEYIKSDIPGVEGKKVEFVPELNFKTGIKFGYRNFTMYIQYSYLSEQFSDSSNATLSNLSGVIGMIPKYDVMDLSIAYKIKNIKFEAGLNNLLNNYYYTRRATGYPGPGIIPSPPRNSYLTLQFKI
ncbi:MAG: TonB-dependent receptor [Flavobacteriaceae bacterium]|nr:TonB-dependent receptor [Flavobacteriaceae bacterium]